MARCYVPKFRDLASHRLANGGTVTMSKFGRDYGICVGSPEWLVAPEITWGLSLDAARAMFADAIRADVLEAE
jgi:hypothetical protein